MRGRSVEKIRRLTYLLAMARLAGRDYRGVLDFLELSGATEGSEPFPAALLEGLRSLIPCYCVSFGEFDAEGAGWRARIRWTGEPPALPTAETVRALRRLRHQIPIPPFGERAGLAMRTSDVCTRAERRRLDLYWEVDKPLGAEYQLWLWLLVPGGVLGGFAFDRQQRDFTERDRLVLDTLAPHLVQRALGARRLFRESSAAAALTSREREVLRHVARGLTNREIAAVLCLSAGTVRKHLDNVYGKLGVGSRAAAVAHVGLSSTADLGHEGLGGREPRPKPQSVSP